MNESISKTPAPGTLPSVVDTTGFDKANKALSDADKLEAGWEYVTIPDRDVYDYVFKGIWLNGTGSQPDYAPGKHLVPHDVAVALNERLAVWARYNTRLMRPQADATTLAQLPQR